MSSPPKNLKVRPPCLEIFHDVFRNIYEIYNFRAGRSCRRILPGNHKPRHPYPWKGEKGPQRHRTFCWDVKNVMCIFENLRQNFGKHVISRMSDAANTSVNAQNTWKTWQSWQFLIETSHEPFVQSLGCRSMVRIFLDLLKAWKK